MGFTIKKYRISVNFYHKLAFLVKSRPPLNFEPKSDKNLKPVKTLCVTNPECGLYDHEIWSFGQFLLETGDFL
jgi:hypothetical protein